MHARQLRKGRSAETPRPPRRFHKDDSERLHCSAPSLSPAGTFGEPAEEALSETLETAPASVGASPYSGLSAARRALYQHVPVRQIGCRAEVVRDRDYQHRRQGYAVKVRHRLVETLCCAGSLDGPICRLRLLPIRQAASPWRNR